MRDSPEVAHRFYVEAQAVAKLRHPNIVEVYDVSAQGDREQYLVVELVRGRTLRGILHDRSPLPPEVAAGIALQLLDALAHAHAQSVVHRDIKPENVLVEMASEAGPTSGGSRAEKSTKIKLTDFGIAKLLDAKGVTSTGQVLGSPAHMAPEQIEGGEVDARSDVFGMGVLMYELMVGHLPFEGANPAQVLRRVLDGSYPPAEMELGTVGKSWSAILDRALAHEACDRYESAAAMRDATAAELERLGVTDPPIEVAKYLDDVDGYTSVHDKRMVGALTKLGAEARKRSDAIGAANDYNRALAYAPSDPALLKLVSTMHASSARKDAVKKAAPAIGLLLSAMTVAFFVTKSIKGHVPDAVVPTTSVPSVAPSTSAGPIASAEKADASPAPTTSRPLTSASIKTPLIAPVRAAKDHVREREAERRDRLGRRRTADRDHRRIRPRSRLQAALPRLQLCDGRALRTEDPAHSRGQDGRLNERRGRDQAGLAHRSRRCGGQLRHRGVAEHRREGRLADLGSDAERRPRSHPRRRSTSPGRLEGGHRQRWPGDYGAGAVVSVRSVRTSQSSGKNVRSSALRKNPTPLDPPVPWRNPMMRLTVVM